MHNCLLVFITLLMFGACGSRNSKLRPNIILILADDQGWGDIGINGNTNIQTPNIDKLAKNGITFDRFFVCPVCSPTRAEILTGRYHVRGGVFDTSGGGERLDLDETTIADIFKAAGYQTAAYGKWHNGMQPPYHPNARGFDDFYGFCSGHWGNYFSPMLEHNGEVVKGNGFTADDFTEHGLQFINKNKHQPFFLYLPFNTPHSPMQVPTSFWDKYRNKEIPLRTNQIDAEDVPFTRAALAMSENIDWNVGRILAKVDELKLEENTIIIYLSDNGPNSFRWNGGMKGRKGSTDEGGVRVPFFIQWKGKFEPGKTISQIAGAIDLLPTLADLSGIEFKTQKPIDGISLKPLLFQENKKWDERFIYHFWNGRTSVRSQRFKLDASNVLFDMETDPGQKSDVSAQFPDIFTKMIVARENWITEVASELDVKSERPFIVGYPGYAFTHLPARDGVPHGGIQRSNKYPNSSYFLNWKNTNDSITWDIDVAADGDFEVEILYTCPAADVGSTLELGFGNSKLQFKITEPHNTKLIGIEEDIYPRMESYEKDFKQIKAGKLNLTKGRNLLTLKAIEIPGSQVMEFRMLMLKRLN